MGSNPTAVDSIKQKHDNRSTVLATRQRLAWVQNAEEEYKERRAEAEEKLEHAKADAVGEAAARKGMRRGARVQGWGTRGKRGQRGKRRLRTAEASVV